MKCSAGLPHLQAVLRTDLQDPGRKLKDDSQVLSSCVCSTDKCDLSTRRTENNWGFSAKAKRGGVTPYPVSGDTALFARGPSGESWPSGTDPGAPAELCSFKRKKKKPKSSNVISVLVMRTKYHRLWFWTALQNASAKRDGSERMCAKWRTGTAGLNWRRGRSSRLDWHHGESKLQSRREMKTSCVLSKSGPKSAVEQGQNRLTSGPLCSVWVGVGMVGTPIALKQAAVMSP